MRKFQKAAVVVAMLGSVGFLGAGVSHAGDEPSFKLDSEQSHSCTGEANFQQALIGLQDTNVAANVIGVGNPSAGATSVECNSILGVG
ncbi:MULTISPECIES: hypothetical protein [unclassified Streptomyces]|jgi:hypothetical protein|uniref:hypothetical protein n=1 Tax=unclassified Streptomyces TaxID=2593676 RepID=UPI0004CB0537|nr:MULTISPECIES: hypothetical protein [unclassified Streptomyces]OSP41128.1 hypothetical protein B7767_22605 [Streptomyces sp. 13-12-16]